MVDLDLTNIESSYRQNDYGAVFYGLVRALKPKRIVELGTYQGYSALHMAAGLRDNAGGQIACVDLWEDYPHRHCSVAYVGERFASNELIAYTLKDDAIYAATRFLDNSVDLLHIDLSNDGDRLAEVFREWEPKLALGATVLVEGGSAERDVVDWMVRYNKRPIRDWLASVASRWSFVTLEPFPSLTMMRRKP